MPILRFTLLFIAALAVSVPAPAPSDGVVVGSRVHPFALIGDAAPPRGSTATLIAFLDFSESSGARPERRGRSESEAEAIRALHDALQDRGLRSVVVDVAPTLLGRPSSVGDLAARVRAWGLERIPVVEDHAVAGLARSYDVRSAPCVFLIDAQGILRGRWDGFVSAADLEASVAEAIWQRPDRSPRAASCAPRSSGP